MFKSCIVKEMLNVKGLEKGMFISFLFLFYCDLEEIRVELLFFYK